MNVTSVFFRSIILCWQKYWQVKLKIYKILYYPYFKITCWPLSSGLKPVREWHISWNHFHLEGGAFRFLQNDSCIFYIFTTIPWKIGTYRKQCKMRILPHTFWNNFSQQTGGRGVQNDQQIHKTVCPYMIFTHVGLVVRACFKYSWKE
jgi:hypothetical protein